MIIHFISIFVSVEQNYLVAFCKEILFFLVDLTGLFDETYCWSTWESYAALALNADFALSRSSFDPGKYYGMPQKSRNDSILNRLTERSCTPAVTSQYRLKAEGNVIHMGTEMNGKR